MKIEEDVITINTDKVRQVGTHEEGDKVYIVIEVEVDRTEVSQLMKDAVINCM